MQQCPVQSPKRISKKWNSTYILIHQLANYWEAISWFVPAGILRAQDQSTDSFPLIPSSLWSTFFSTLRKLPFNQCIIWKWEYKQSLLEHHAKDVVCIPGQAVCHFSCSLLSPLLCQCSSIGAHLSDRSRERGDHKVADLLYQILLLKRVNPGHCLLTDTAFLMLRFCTCVMLWKTASTT